MREFVDIIRGSEPYQRLRDAVGGCAHTQAEGLWGSSSVLVLAALAQDLSRWVLLVTSSSDDAENAVDDLELFAPGLPWLFPAWETLPCDDAPPNVEVVSHRLALLRSLLFDQAHLEERPRMIVASVQSLLQPVMSPQAMREGALTVQVGAGRGHEDIVRWLAGHGFQTVPQVEIPGEVSRRGGILDVFPFSSPQPYRVEFFGDEVESIRRFDVATQVSQDQVSEFQLVALPSTVGGPAARSDDQARHSLVSYLPRGAVYVLREPHAVRDRAERLRYGLEGMSTFLTVDAVDAEAEGLAQLELSNLPFDDETNLVRFRVDTAGDYGSNAEAAMIELRRVAHRNAVTYVMCNNQAEQQRFHELWAGVDEADLNPVVSRVGHVTQGFQCHDSQLAMVGYHEMFKRYRQRRAPRRPQEVRDIDTFLDLEPGDLVVHAVHGIARFLGVEALEQDGKLREFMALQFANRAKLYVPASKVELVQKYVGSGEHAPGLSVLGGVAWARRKARAEKAAEDLASDLLDIQMAREASPGIVFPADDEWQREFEAAFIYEETDDQICVAEEIKTDMCSRLPMDRLVCGDVGYGKTELAMRAAFKAVMGGKQVAVLVPTTILAQQHYTTFSERMADYPIDVAVLSRFSTKAQQRAILERLRLGQTDVVIGTHRLIQHDVEFKDLGLLVIDEEQRFGVKQKERLKHLRAIVDVLTLTATPIPRTLHMALLGIRNISSLATPPHDRLSIHTRLWRFDPEKIREAILHELNRDGQVFFVHNRVYNIQSVAQEVQRMVPEARVAVAHGRMPERQLERRIIEFINREIDVLVCTTIIESGVDMPNVNTICINRADHFGLAELHQLRGRVGRYKHRAYAYLLLPPGRPVTPDAEKRLKAIEEFSELGSGFKIAMRDMEIRGAGNILGSQQHGHIAAVGYDMYCRLLDAAVKKARGREVLQITDVALNLRLEAHLPDSYVSHAKQKIELYRRLNRCGSLDAIEQVLMDIRDRYGPVPEPCRQLALENGIRLLAERIGLTTISYTPTHYILMAPDAELIEGALSRVRKRLRTIDERTAHLLLPKPGMSPTAAARFLRKTLKRGK